jgi:tetratricopeptide (TPR) repeat protein
MKSLLKKLIGILCLACCLPFGSQAQSLDQAKKLYNAGQFKEAKPAFEKLVNQSPNNSSYNLWYGVCCYETGDFETAEKYLLIAKARKAGESYRYLACIYTRAYRFEEATAMWENYIELMDKKKEEVEAYKVQLARVEKLQRMKEKTEDVQIIDSIVVPKNQLLSAYYLSTDCGALQTYEDFFQSSNPILSTVYINSKNDQAYYALPSAEGRFALYTQSKLMDVWTDEKPVLRTDSADNNYPFVLGDGLTLYFASKGNGSIGGYDLFVTRYNTKSNSFLIPEQLGMPFNSPANDYLMVIDEVKGLGWFVSDRNQPDEKACVYLFIPDASRRRIAESDDRGWLCRRAMLSSIKDTWVEGSDYAEKILTARTPTSADEKKVEKDFEFVVNDQTLYYRWDEFRSAEAKSFYEKAIGLKKQAQTLAKQLTEARETYSKGNPSVRRQTSAFILQAEKDLERLRLQADEWEKQARNRENVQLKH